MKGIKKVFNKIKHGTSKGGHANSVSSVINGKSGQSSSSGGNDTNNNEISADQLREESENLIKNEPWFSEGLSIFVFGASGDLAKKKTYPSLFALFCAGTYEPKTTVICGYARSAKSDDEFRGHLKPFLIKSGTNEHKDWSKDRVSKKVDEFLKLCIYRAGNYDSPADFGKVVAEVDAIHRSHGLNKENRVFYFALPPDVFVSTANSVKQAGLTNSGGFNRLVIEKPFGHDTESARKLGKDLGELFTEEYIYRIDHYLGKEMVQNLIVLRFGNSFLEPLWNRNYINAVLISFKEDIGTQGRGGYFDTSGIIRDVMQNHLMQVLSIVAMERPVKVAGEGYSNYVRDEKVKALHSIPPIKLEDIVIGQYVGNPDKNEPGYLEDSTVPPGSTCPTFCTAVIHINNARWEGVPFIMKAGKALDQRRSEIRIQFKPPPGAHDLYQDGEIPLNELVIRLQPSEAIYMKTNVKKPGLATIPIQSELDLTYESRYPIAALEDAYTRLILDVLRGKQATFVRNDELMAAWEIFTPLLHELEEKKVKPIPYVFGSRGPVESDELIERYGYVRNTDYQKQWQEAQQQSKASKSS